MLDTIIYSGTKEEGQWLIHRQLQEDAQKAKAADKAQAIQSMDNEDNVFGRLYGLASNSRDPETESISALYYKSKLCVHHFTVYNLANKDVWSYVWHEVEGGLTANEFACCNYWFY